MADFAIPDRCDHTKNPDLLFEELALRWFEHIAREVHVVRQDLRSLRRKVQHMSEVQDQIDAALAVIQDVDTGLDASVTRIEAKLAELEGQGVDVSALTAEVANLRTHADAVNAIVPESPPTE